MEFTFNQNTFKKNNYKSPFHFVDSSLNYPGPNLSLFKASVKDQIDSSEQTSKTTTVFRISVFFPTIIKWTA